MNQPFLFWHLGEFPRNPHSGISSGGLSFAPGQWILFPFTGVYWLLRNKNKI